MQTYMYTDVIRLMGSIVCDLSCGQIHTDMHISDHNLKYLMVKTLKSSFFYLDVKNSDIESFKLLLCIFSDHTHIKILMQATVDFIKTSKLK